MTDHERRRYEAQLLQDYYLHAMPEAERDALAPALLSLSVLRGVGDITALHTIYQLGRFMATWPERRWRRVVGE